MALDSKKYIRASETLFDILDALKDGLATADPTYKTQGVVLDVENGHLCFSWRSGELNSVTLDVDLAADTCIIVLSGEGQWYTDMTGPLDTAFGV
jgi:hypothetical protein